MCFQACHIIRRTSVWVKYYTPLAIFPLTFWVFFAFFLTTFFIVLFIPFVSINNDDGGGGGGGGGDAEAEADAEAMISLICKTTVCMYVCISVRLCHVFLSVSARVGL